MKKKIPTEFFWKSWRLITENGRQFWKYSPIPELKERCKRLHYNESQTLAALSEAFIFDKKINPNSSDSVYRSSCRAGSRKSSPLTRGKDSRLLSSLRTGWDYFLSLQAPDGHFPADYGGPLFLIPGLALFSFLTGHDFGKPQTLLMKRYILNHQNPDGGWGLHIEGESIMFTTVINYVALRLWGEGDTLEMGRARKWIQENGGAGKIPSWGKYFLALLGLYEWEGIHSLIPEAWLLPRWCGISPHNFWCHSRMVYLPLSYLYGVRFHPSPEQIAQPIIQELRKEIYLEEYEQISWPKLRSQCCSRDLFFPLNWRFRVGIAILNFYERYHFRGLRSRALSEMERQIDREDQQTHYINLGPINKVYNALVVFHRLQRDPLDQDLQRAWKMHRDRFQDYLWLAEDGMKMSGYNGSQFWDVAFTSHALFSLPPQERSRYRSSLKRIQSYVVAHRLDEGGWPFSTKDQFWPTTDCSAEGLHVSLNGETSAYFPYQKLAQSADFLLGLQNREGGWSSYELRQGPTWMEYFNSSMVFGGIMVDYPYVECTSANIQALTRFHSHYPDYRSQEIRRAIGRGKLFIVREQGEDGSWYGSWGICFNYGVFFAVKALVSGGLEREHREVVERAVGFLLKKQNADGSWGESPLSSVQKVYHNLPGQVVHTSWAILSLLAVEKAGGGDEIREAVMRGLRFLLESQESDGDWPQQNITGVFNHNCMISYTHYRNIFPLWALGEAWAAGYSEMDFPLDS